MRKSTKTERETIKLNSIFHFDVVVVFAFDAATERKENQTLEMNWNNQGSSC